MAESNSPDTRHPAQTLNTNFSTFLISTLILLSFSMTASGRNISIDQEIMMTPCFGKKLQSGATSRRHTFSAAMSMGRSL